jgi:Mg2+/Co2+ transporter CorC
MLFWEDFRGKFVPLNYRTSVSILIVVRIAQIVKFAHKVYMTIKELHKDYMEGLLHPSDLQPVLSNSLNKFLQVNVHISHYLSRIMTCGNSFLGG